MTGVQTCALPISQDAPQQILWRAQIVLVNLFRNARTDNPSDVDTALANVANIHQTLMKLAEVEDCDDR